MNTRVVTVNPRELKLLDINARYMRHETYSALVQNVKRDGKLTSVPFAARNGDGRYEVLSGNHRVKAAIDAGLETIDVMVTDDELTKDQRLAIQLSHNALSGEDDPAVLKQLYDAIGTVEFKAYAGLDDKMLELLKSVQIGSIGEANLDFQTISFTFLPAEIESARAVFAEAKKLMMSDENWLARWGDYDLFMDSLEEAGAAYNVKNMATALALVTRVFMDHRSDLSKGWLSGDGETVLHKGWVPLASVLGTSKIPAEAAITIKRAIDKMASKGEVSPTALWQAVEFWAAEYMSGA